MTTGANTAYTSLPVTRWFVSLVLQLRLIRGTVICQITATLHMQTVGRNAHDSQVTDNEMKTDLAPKFLYYYVLTVFVLGLVVVGIIHQYAMEYFIKSNAFFPFIFTSVFWVVELLGVLFIINKCRYITINPTDENKLIIGNILANGHGRSENLTVVKKVWTNLFKVTFEGKNYHIFSFDKTVDEFKQKKNGQGHSAQQSL